jgi:hypothetical protein
MAYYKAAPRRSPTLTDLLLNAARENKLFPRLYKDIEHGEFNMSLYGVTAIESVPSALLAFGGNLAYLSQVYARRYTHLVEILELISSRLGDNRVSTLLLRFVRFHEVLYSNAHTSLAGEFAA